MMKSFHLTIIERGFYKLGSYEYVESIAQVIERKFELKVKEVEGHVIYIDTAYMLFDNSVDKGLYIENATQELINYIQHDKNVYSVDCEITYEEIKLIINF